MEPSISACSKCRSNKISSVLFEDGDIVSLEVGEDVKFDLVVLVVVIGGASRMS